MLKELLGSDGVLALITLWCHLGANRSDGSLAGMSAVQIKYAAEWPGEPEVFVGALLEIGFLERDGDGFYAHGWEDRNPWAAGSANRSEAASKAGKASAAKRAANKGIEQAIDDRSTDPNVSLHSVERNSTECSTDFNSLPSPSPLPSPTPSHDGGVAPAREGPSTKPSTAWIRDEDERAICRIVRDLGQQQTILVMWRRHPKKECPDEAAREYLRLNPNPAEGIKFNKNHEAWCQKWLGEPLDRVPRLDRAFRAGQLRSPPSSGFNSGRAGQVNQAVEESFRAMGAEGKSHVKVDMRAEINKLQRGSS